MSLTKDTFHDVWASHLGGDFEDWIYINNWIWNKHINLRDSDNLDSDWESLPLHQGRQYGLHHFHPNEDKCYPVIENVNGLECLICGDIVPKGIRSAILMSSKKHGGKLDARS